MSRLSISLIIGSIFIVTLCQSLAQHAVTVRSFSAAQVLLASGLLYCALKIYCCWLSSPPPQSAEDENNDPQNEE
jgi:hypothetical protein